MELLISLICGAIGGNLAGGLFKNFNLGLVLNSAAGIAGGSLGGQFLTWTGGGLASFASRADGALDPTALSTQVMAGGLGGALALLAFATARNLLTR